ncbi:MAG: trigger factor, partial [Clostridia bacterium]|nr:trigger factor [Clostridia bacterium]
IAFTSTYRKILKEEKEFNPIDEPEIKIDSFLPEKGLTMSCEVEVMPEFELGKYTGHEVKKATGEVSEEKIEKELKQVQERQARFVDVERDAKMGDIATIDFAGSVDGVLFDGGSATDYRLELGSKSFIDTFEEQVAGMKIGESKDVKVKFPENYGSEELAGKDAVFAVTLKKVEEKQLPEINDEFASNVSEFETLADYKADIRKHLEESLKVRLEREDENNLISAVVNNTEVEIPECLVERQLDMFVRDFETRLSYQGMKLEDYLKYVNMTVEQMREERKEQAKETVKTRLVLEKLIIKENLNVTQEEVDARLQEFADKYKKSLEDYKKSMGEKNLIYFENDILMDKVIKFLKENNKLA